MFVSLHLMTQVVIRDRVKSEEECTFESLSELECRPRRTKLKSKEECTLESL